MTSPGAASRPRDAVAILGRAAVGPAVSASVLVVVSFVDRGATVAVVALFVVCLSAALWFVLPLARRHTGSRYSPAGPGNGWRWP